jgi:hypothetical protein
MAHSRNRPASINSGFTTAEMTAIDERRGSHSRAGWLRNAGLVAIDKAPERPGRRGVPPADLEAVARMNGTLGRTAGATIQLAKALRESGHGSFHALSERILADLRQQADDLAVIIERLK